MSFVLGEAPCPEQGNTMNREGQVNAQDIPSSSACSDLCRQNEDCKHWSWHDAEHPSHANWCTTMTNVGGGGIDQSQRGIVSGDRNCRPGHT